MLQDWVWSSGLDAAWGSVAGGGIQGGGGGGGGDHERGRGGGGAVREVRDLSPRGRVGGGSS